MKIIFGKTKFNRVFHNLPPSIPYTVLGLACYIHQNYETVRCFVRKLRRKFNITHYLNPQLNWIFRLSTQYPSGNFNMDLLAMKMYMIIYSMAIQSSELWMENKKYYTSSKLFTSHKKEKYHNLYVQDLLGYQYLLPASTENSKSVGEISPCPSSPLSVWRRPARPWEVPPGTGSSLTTSGWGLSWVGCSQSSLCCCCPSWFWIWWPYK